MANQRRREARAVDQAIEIDAGANAHSFQHARLVLQSVARADFVHRDVGWELVEHQTKFYHARHATPFSAGWRAPAPYFYLGRVMSKRSRVRA